MIMKILFDLDDFNDLEEIFFKEESPISRLDIARKVMSSEVMARKHEIYYYLLRNSVLLGIEEGDEDVTLMHQEKELFQSLAAKAIVLAENDYMVHNRPCWITNMYNDVDAYCKDEQLKEIVRKTTVHIRTMATINIEIHADGKITFPILTKCFYKNYMIILFSLIQNWHAHTLEENDALIFKSLFPFFLHYCDPTDVRLTALPRVRIHDEGIYTHAKRVAHFQSTFIFLHEIAHFGFNHFDHTHLQQHITIEGFNELFQDKENYKEYEADAMAFILMQNFPEREIDDIYVAIHGMFQFYSTLFIFREYYHHGKNFTENIFQKRYRVLTSVPGNKRASNDTRALMAIISGIYDRFLTTLNSSSRNEIDKTIQYYTENNQAQVSFDRLFGF